MRWLWGLLIVERLFRRSRYRLDATDRLIIVLTLAALAALGIAVSN